MPYWPSPDVYDLEEDAEGRRSCARLDRCEDPRFIDTEHGNRVRLPALTPRTFCHVCEGAIGQHLDELPELYDRVHGEIGNKTRGHGPKVTVSKSAPVPINLGVDALLREITYVLDSWELRVRSAARLSPGPSRSVTQSVKVLSGHLATLLSLPMDKMTRTTDLGMLARGFPPSATGEGTVHVGGEWAEVVLEMGGADAGLEVLYMHYRCRNLLQETRPPAVHLPVPCGECGTMQLYERRTDDGDPDGAYCYGCRTSYSDNGYTLLRGEAYAVAEVRRETAGVGVRNSPRPVEDEKRSGRA
jgi:hypothetical protein